jgi:hypothetical protein
MLTGVTFSLVMKLRVSHVPLVLVEDPSFRGVVAGRPGWRDRTVARWRPRPLDEALAAGTPPEASAALALRAQRLTEPGQRRSIAQALRTVLQEAREGPRPSRVRIVPSRSRVAAAGAELAGLADALADPGPVAARGAAEALLLLTDGTGPLYNPRRGSSLRTSAFRAAQHLRPWPA